MHMLLWRSELGKMRGWVHLRRKGTRRKRAAPPPAAGSRGSGWAVPLRSLSRTCSRSRGAAFGSPLSRYSFRHLHLYT